MIKEPQAAHVVPVGYPVPRRAVLAGTVAAGVLAWARRPAGPAAAQTNRDLGWAGGPANVRVSRDAFTMHAEPSLAANPADPRNLLAACMGLAGWPTGPSHLCLLRRGQHLAPQRPAAGGDARLRRRRHRGVRRPWNRICQRVGRQPRRRAAWPGMPVAHRRWRAKLHHAGDRGHRPARPPVARRRPVGPLRPRHLVRRGRLLSAAAGWRSPGPPTAGAALSHCASPTPAATPTAVALQ
jgi:hypothetical protein